MEDIHIVNYILIFFLTFIQTIVGTGVLIIGTPIFLFLNYEMIEIMKLLLPISILTSLLNLIVNKSKIKIRKIFNNYEIKSFFIICIPSIFLGLVVLKNFKEIINFDLIVASIILISLIIVEKTKNFKFQLTKKMNNTINFIIGIVHGLTNSGGSLLSLLVISKGEKNKNINFYKITFFYFFLALFQYLIIIYLFRVQYNFENTLKILIWVILGILIGNLLSKNLNIYLFKLILKILSSITALFLITKNFYLS